MTQCETCGQWYQTPDWPWCPHGKSTYTNVPDDVPGGFTVENAWREPRTFYSQREYEKALAADGMQLNPHHVPGGKLANWATVDPQTLENARVLVSRGSGGGKDPEVVCETQQWQTRVHEGAALRNDFIDISEL